MSTTTLTLSGIALAFTLLIGAPASLAGNAISYEVTITNLTQGQTFTPILVTSHKQSIALFTAGEQASPELAALAEGGSTEGVTEILEGAGNQVGDVKTIGGLLEPGKTTDTTFRANRHTRHFSMAAMLIPTNDTFVALNSVQLPYYGSRTYYAKAYDAGTEANDQSCANMPGPRCGGSGPSPEPAAGDEGFIHISNGFHELGDFDATGAEVLHPAGYDWRNPVAKVTITRIHRHHR